MLFQAFITEGFLEKYKQNAIDLNTKLLSQANREEVAAKKIYSFVAKIAAKRKRESANNNSLSDSIETKKVEPIKTITCHREPPGERFKGILKPESNYLVTDLSLRQKRKLSFYKKKEPVGDNTRRVLDRAAKNKKIRLD